MHVSPSRVCGNGAVSPVTVSSSIGVPGAVNTARTVCGPFAALVKKHDTLDDEIRELESKVRDFLRATFPWANNTLGISDEEAELQDRVRAVYEARLERGIAREQARKDLPLCTYTEAYWKIDLHNLLHFLALRMDSHAQQEIRDYATVIGEEIAARWVPIT